MLGVSGSIIYNSSHGLRTVTYNCRRIFAALTNVAPGKPALQSSADADHVAGFAVDGDVTTCAMGNTRDNQWLRVDLRNEYKVVEVIIVTGTYQCK